MVYTSFVLPGSAMQLSAQSASREALALAEELTRQTSSRVSAWLDGTARLHLPAQLAGDGEQQSNSGAHELSRDIVELSQQAADVKASVATLRVAGSVADEIVNLGRRVDVRG
jgi:hypothetical protein